MKTARMTIEMWSLVCPHCDEAGHGEGWFADDRTGSFSLTSDSEVQGKRLNCGDTLKCEVCGVRCRVPARP